jgi:hypothetical protein
MTRPHLPDRRESDFVASSGIEGSDSEGLLRWDAGLVRPGSYRVRGKCLASSGNEVLSFETRIETGPEGDRSARIIGMVEFDRLQEAGRGVWKTRVPAGRVRIKGPANPEEIEVPSGQAEVTVTLSPESERSRHDPTGLLIVSLMDGRYVVPSAGLRLLREDGSEIQPKGPPGRHDREVLIYISGSEWNGSGEILRSLFEAWST